MLSSSVVTNPRVPRLVRHSLNLESGLNDGLALPAVLAFSAALATSEGDFVWYEFVLQDVALGFAFGVVFGFLASLRCRAGGRAGIPPHHKSLYVLGVAFATYGVTVLEPAGNGFIAVFVCAITLGIRRPDLREVFEQRADDIVEIVKLGIFVVFGALLTFDGLFMDGWAAVGVVAFTLLLARPIAIWIALAGRRDRHRHEGLHGLVRAKGRRDDDVLDPRARRSLENGERIFNLAALAVFCSIVLHGLTDTPGSEWLARRSPEDEERTGTSAAELLAAGARARRCGGGPWWRSARASC